MDRNETLADIVADILKLAKDYREAENDGEGGIAFCCDIADELRDFAKRLKRAIKRENCADVADDKPQSATHGIGNAAKLRDAVEGIEMLLGAGGDLDREELAKECARALAAPPRNCDVYATEYDANEAFDKKCAQRGDGIHACFGCKYNAAERGGLPSISHCRVAWLFDAAQEGGDHADA